MDESAIKVRMLKWKVEHQKAIEGFRRHRDEDRELWKKLPDMEPEVRLNAAISHFGRSIGERSQMLAMIDGPIPAESSGQGAHTEEGKPLPWEPEPEEDPETGELETT